MNKKIQAGHPEKIKQRRETAITTLFFFIIAGALFLGFAPKILWSMFFSSSYPFEIFAITGAIFGIIFGWIISSYLWFEEETEKQEIDELVDDDVVGPVIMGFLSGAFVWGLIITIGFKEEGFYGGLLYLFVGFFISFISFFLFWLLFQALYVIVMLLTISPIKIYQNLKKSKEERSFLKEISGRLTTEQKINSYCLLVEYKNQVWVEGTSFEDSALKYILFNDISKTDSFFIFKKEFNTLDFVKKSDKSKFSGEDWVKVCLHVLPSDFKILPDFESINNEDYIKYTNPVVVCKYCDENQVVELIKLKIPKSQNMTKIMHELDIKPADDIPFISSDTKKIGLIEMYDFADGDVQSGNMYSDYFKVLFITKQGKNKYTCYEYTKEIWHPAEW